jgi:hypothetical protein
MRILVILALATAMTAINSQSPLVGTRTHVFNSCLPASDAVGTRVREVLEEVGSSSDSVYLELRASFGLPITQPSAISAVAADSICERASRVIDSVHNRAAPHPVYVWRFGTYYAVHDTTLQAGEWKLISFLDSSFAFRRSLGY